MLAISLIMADRETAIGYGFIVGMTVSLIGYAIIIGKGLQAVLLRAVVSVIIALGLSFSLFRFSRMIDTPSLVTFCLAYVLPLLIAAVIGSAVSNRVAQARK